MLSCIFDASVLISILIGKFLFNVSLSCWFLGPERVEVVAFRSLHESRRSPIMVRSSNEARIAAANRGRNVASSSSSTADSGLSTVVTARRRRRNVHARIRLPYQQIRTHHGCHQFQRPYRRRSTACTSPSSCGRCVIAGRRPSEYEPG